MKSTEQIMLTVTPRQTGKHNSRAFRRSEKIPVVLYGPSVKQPHSLLMDELTVTRYAGRKFESTIFRITSTDSAINNLAVLVKAVQVHPVTRRPEHVDLYAVDMTKEIRVRIEIRLEGKPAGLAEGGMLQAIVRELEIECLPTAIPEFIAADVSELGVGDSLHVYDLKLPAGIKVITGSEQTIATVNILAEEVAAPVVTAAVEGATATAAGAAAPAAGAAAAPGAAAPAADKGAAKK